MQKRDLSALASCAVVGSVLASLVYRAFNNNMQKKSLLLYARSMPKVELHVHFEGSILPETLLVLAQRNNVELPFDTVEGLCEWFTFSDFNHFIEIYLKIVECLKTLEDFKYAAYQFGKFLKSNNVQHAEVTFTVALHVGHPQEAIMKAVNEGRALAEKDFGVAWRWIIDIPRNFPKTADATLQAALAGMGKGGVVALGLGGSEADFPATLFTKQFQAAKAQGLNRIPHAGEMAGPESVWDCIKKLDCQRIGHGVRSIEDPKLVEYLVKTQMHLEICPSSNIKLNIYDDYASHPLRKLWDAGCNISINSDDPPLFNTTLNDEFEICVEHFGFTADELDKSVLNAIKASLLSEEEKADLTASVQEGFLALRETLQL